MIMHVLLHKYIIQPIYVYIYTFTSSYSRIYTHTQNEQPRKKQMYITRTYDIFTCFHVTLFEPSTERLPQRNWGILKTAGYNKPLMLLRGPAIPNLFYFFIFLVWAFTFVSVLINL